MKRTLLSVGMIAAITAPNLVTADTTNSLSGSLSIGAIVIDSGNNLNPDGSEK